MKRVLPAAAILALAILAAWAVYHYGVAFIAGGSYRRENVAIGGPADTEFSSPTTVGFSFLDAPRVLPDVRFTDGEGRPLSLADFRGRPILLNVWATWCGPCRKEMPALERLQVPLGPSNLLVLPLSIDRQGAAAVKQFYGELGLKVLGVYVDASGNAMRELNAVGVPTTLMIDREGREIGVEIGGAEWDSAAVIALIRQHLALPPGQPDAQGP